MRVGLSGLWRTACALALAFAASVAGGAAPAHQADAAPRQGIERGYLKSSVSPCADFYEYANGAWLDTARIAGSFPFAGAGLETYQRNQALLSEILTRAAAQAAHERDGDLRKLGILYATLTDSTRADSEGIAPLAAQLGRIDAIASARDLVAVFAELQSEGEAVPFELAADADAHDSRQMVAVLRQGGLGMPDRDYYLREDPQSDSLRVFYRQHLAQLLVLAGLPRSQATDDADHVLALETQLADSCLGAVQRRDPESTYHKLSLLQLSGLAPQIDWVAYFQAVGIPQLARPNATLVVEAPSFVRQLGALVGHAPLSTWRAYLRVHAIEAAAGWLGERLDEEDFLLRAKLTGQPRPSPRAHRALEAVDAVMGDALGKAFVAKAFPPQAKVKARELVDDLQAALDARLAKVEWMSPGTRRAAGEKLAKLAKKIGYPDHWRDYTALQLDATNSGWENLRRAREFEQRRQWKQVGHPVDRRQWQMSPATLNAYYNASNNEIVFPAAFLQPPMFDPKGDDAVNYGAAGAVIGHELTHGFDDQGHRFDADGNLTDWWTAQDVRRFEALTERIVSEYNGFVPVDTLHINGRLTLGENLADLGGLEIAYDAYERHLEKRGRTDIEGLTPEQRFFLAFAQSRRSTYRPELTRMVILGDTHPPDRFRVNGTVCNMPEFAAAFGCHRNDPMVRSQAERVRIW